MAEQFYTILTKIGKAKIANTTALNTKINLIKFKVGDGGGSYYNPTEDQTELVNKVFEGNISSITIDDKNPNWIVIETVIPGEIGGFTIREAGVFDDEDNLIAIGKYPETYKPAVQNGSTKDLYIRMILEVSNTSSVTLKVDPTVILATKKDIQILSNDLTNFKQEVNTQLADITKDIKNIDLSADKVTLSNPNLKSTNVNDGLTELFQYADNGKKLISNVIGSPLSATDTFQQQKDKIQGLKNTMASNLSSKGQSASGTEGLNSLISKIKNIDTFKTAKGVLPATEKYGTVTVTGLTFDPKIILIYRSNTVCGVSGYDYDGIWVSITPGHYDWYVPDLPENGEFTAKYSPYGTSTYSAAWIAYGY